LKKTKNILFVCSGAAIVFLIIRKRKKMETTATNTGDFYNNLVNFIKQKEGGLSNDSGDLIAAKNPSPTPQKYHTNKGVTYKTFIDSAASLKYNPSTENFLNMPNNIWGGIFKNKFYNKALLITKNPILAGYIAYWYWQGYDHNFLPFKLISDTLDNSQTNKQKLQGLVNLRKLYYSNLVAKYPKYSKFLKGWMATANDFYTTFNTYL